MACAALICSRAGAGPTRDAASRSYGLLSFAPRPCARESGPATPTRGAPSPQAKASSAQPRPDPLGLDAVALAAGMDSSTEDRAAGDGDRLAPHRMAPLLDVEVTESVGSATVEPRSPGTDCPNVDRQSSLGYRAHPRRTPQARVRGQQSIDTQVSMARSAAREESELANVPAESDQGHLGSGPVRGADDWLQVPIRVFLDQPRAPGADSFQRHR